MSMDNLQNAKPITKEEVKEVVEQIMELQKQEYCHINDTRVGFDEDEIRGADEDAYLCYLKMVRMSRPLSEKQFNEHGLDGVFDCTRDALEIPLFEDYLEEHKKAN